MRPELTRQHAKAARLTTRHILRTSEANKSAIEGMRDDLLNRHRSWSTVEAYARALAGLDMSMGGRPFSGATAEDLRRFLASIRSPSVRSTRTHILALTAALRYPLNVEPGDKLPAHLRKALVLPSLPKDKQRHVLTDEDFEALLLAAQQRPARFLNTPWTEEVQAMLWVLWASGFRIDELLSLNVGDVEFDGQDGAWLNLREEAPALGHGALKTGPRRIYVLEGVPAVRAWLALHPAGTVTSSPLFSAYDDRTGKVRMSYNSVQKYVLPRLNRTTGLSGRKPAGFHLHPHLFRHTCATRKARLGWNEAQLRAFFGWSKNSKEASTYVHLAAADMRALVRQNHGLDAGGRSNPMEASAVESQLARALARLLGRPGAG